MLTEEELKEGTKRAMKELEMEQKVNRAVRICNDRRKLWQDLEGAIVSVLKNWDIPGSSIGMGDLYEVLDRGVAKRNLELLRQKKKMKVVLENGDLKCGIISYERDNKKIIVEFSFNVEMSLEVARILGGMRHKNIEDIELADYFRSAREGAFKDKWKITMELKDFEKE